jgi:hypothetical protein
VNALGATVLSGGCASGGPGELDVFDAHLVGFT